MTPNPDTAWPENAAAWRARAERLRASAVGRADFLAAMIRSAPTGELPLLEQLWRRGSLPLFGQPLWPWRLWSASDDLVELSQAWRRVADPAIEAMANRYPGWLPLLCIDAEMPITADRWVGLAPDGGLWELDTRAEPRAPSPLGDTADGHARLAAVAARALPLSGASQSASA